MWCFVCKSIRGDILKAILKNVVIVMVLACFTIGCQESDSSSEQLLVLPPGSVTNFETESAWYDDADENSFDPDKKVAIVFLSSSHMSDVWGSERSDDSLEMFKDQKVKDALSDFNFVHRRLSPDSLRRYSNGHFDDLQALVLEDEETGADGLVKVLAPVMIITADFELPDFEGQSNGGEHKEKFFFGVQPDKSQFLEYLQLVDEARVADEARGNQGANDG